MCHWTGDNAFFEPHPEGTPEMPWDRLKEIGGKVGRGPGKNRKIFARKFIRKHFHIERAARHPDCPSARYLASKLRALGALIPNPIQESHTRPNPFQGRT
uniref:Uncharacterized protein n=1 Tax=Candidatus Kentrum sp. LFY TaxID=2126342 RepID=A0A450UYZ5_9GAMM|nr:MAG: hypothetical protein BECKLFY1418A_GA0070994_107322 [Candidatus Kentron sp. LFY]